MVTVVKHIIDILEILHFNNIDLLKTNFITIVTTYTT